ncbi:K02A2.6-like [Cordylochernes scorpioides]|uniref:K02A2.6-like n=1 Tax=Cordylochernes scorpioides TaxID=51811 RepID=A0ABY6K8A9_9ARAC|nr:K02A2.6-like [Cordylochernes scorpioides]
MFLKQFGLSIDIGRNLLRTSDEDIPLLISQQLHNFQACRVLALEDTQVPPRSECVIKGQLETTKVIPKFVILEGDSEAPSRGILVAKELVDTERDVIPVRVVNLYDSARTIKKGSCLGNTEPAVLIKRNHPVMQKSKREDNVPDHLQQVWEETMKELQPGQQKELATILATYGNIFAKSSENYGRTDLTKHRINTEAETLVKEILDQNIIEPSSSPWVSPVVLLKKKDGPTRFCVDYRKLNDITKKDSYPFPRIDATLDTLAGSQWFSTLDLKSGYWQVEMHPDDKDCIYNWIWIMAVQYQEASTVSEALLQDWVCIFGVPRILHSDQGRNFESNIFQELCRRLGIEKTRTTPLHPQSDGMVERFNRTLTQHLTMFVDKNQRDWDQHLPMLLMAYRSAEHESTGHSLARMLFGHELRMPCDVLLGRPEETFENTNEYISHLEERMLTIHQWAREKLHFSSEKMKDRYNFKTSHKTYKEGEMVWLYNPQRKKGLSPKLQYQWEGPYKIIKCLNDVIYRIQKTRTSKPKVVHYNRLAPFRGSVPEQWTVRDDQS